LQHVEGILLKYDTKKETELPRVFKKKTISELPNFSGKDVETIEKLPKREIKPEFLEIPKKKILLENEENAIEHKLSKMFYHDLVRKVDELIEIEKNNP
jgi:hypothetical protein